MKKFAILLIGYNKLNTFSETLKALKENTRQYDLFVKLDNCGNPEISESLKKEVLKYFPDADITIRPKRFSLDINVICSLNETFSLGYDGIFYTEDDIIYDKTALETLENLEDWTEKNIPGKIGIVQSWNYNITDPKYSEYYYNDIHELSDLKYSCSFSENEIGYTGQNSWGCIITKKCWDTIKDDLLRIYSHIMTKRSVDNEVLYKWEQMLKNIKVSDALKKRIVSRYNPINWESNIDLAMLAYGMYKICLTNPRSKTIGAIGATSVNEMFIRCGLDKIKTLNSEKIPKEFILNKESEEKWFN